MAEAGGSEEQEEAAVDWALLSEVEVLESIYLDELHVSKGNGRSVPWEISITLYPATAENQDSQYVCFTLVLSVPLEYPNEAPKIAIRNPRGLSDEQIQKISQTLQCVTEAQLGSAVLYELIEKGKEILTDNNIPHGQCVICLYGFQENEVFTKTQCYHYFHSHCLARYTEHMEKEIRAERKERVQCPALLPKEEVEVQCPVCREPLEYNLAVLQAAPPPHHPTELYHPDLQTLQHKEQLHLIYKRQQEKGGIIDPEAERNRYFISLQKSPVAAVDEQVAVSENALDAKKEPTPSTENTQEAAEAVSSENKAERSERSSVLHNKRERIHGERPLFRGPAWQLRYKPREAPAETHCLLTVEGESRAFNRRPNWRRGRGQWSCGKYSQDFQKPCNRDQGSSCSDKKELCTRGISLANEGSPFIEEKNAVGKSQPQGREEDDWMVSHSEPKGPTKWQSQHGMPDCRRWEKIKGREYGSYPKMPRGRGWTRPNSRRESQGREPEGGS